MTGTPLLHLGSLAAVVTTVLDELWGRPVIARVSPAARDGARAVGEVGHDLG